MKRSKFPKAHEKGLSKLTVIFLAVFIPLVLFFISDGFRSLVINIIAAAINTLVLSNLFLFNLVVIGILLGLIILVLYIYSKL